jgi:hypothetical protein
VREGPATRQAGRVCRNSCRWMGTRPYPGRNDGTACPYTQTHTKSELQATHSFRKIQSKR